MKKRVRLYVELPLPEVDIFSHGIKAILSNVFVFVIVFWRWIKGTVYLSEKGFQEWSVPCVTWNEFFCNLGQLQGISSASGVQVKAYAGWAGVFPCFNIK